MKATVIGLGTMGGAIARRLVDKGFDVGGYDLEPAAVERLVEAGGRAVDPQQDGLGEVVLTSLPNDGILTSAVLESGLLDRMGGGLLVEASTALPATVEQIVERAKPLGIEVVDSPFSGGPNEALAGSLVQFVGASEPALERARPVLEALGSIEHVGEAGQGKTVKLVNNLMAMGNVVVAMEAFTLGTKLGMDREKLFDVLSRSGARSFHFLKRMPYVLADDYSARFALDLGGKDIRLGLQLAHEQNYAMPTASTVHQIFELGRAHGLGGEDVVAVMKVFQGWAEGKAPTPDA
ncbi:NAD(P)-dependent oxidoreductase [Streptomyces sp. NPDC005349]|uniref:NAD(P)-dependent oxidoreductase n=1 Tax=Streptomyces sp. NPDC005349 TaxID=3157037 RepID=UPI0033AA6745